MYADLNEYLFQHKSISIPGLGSLVAEHVPAMADFANKQLLPMQNKFRFDKYIDTPEKNFFSFLAKKKNIADFEVIHWYNEFAASLCTTIKTGEQVVWDGVGAFKQDFGGEVVFEPHPPAYHLYSPVKAERIVHATASHSILVGDQQKTNYEMTEMLNNEVYIEKESWWIYALILAAIAISILFFYLYSNNMRWGTGNQQRIELVK